MMRITELSEKLVNEMEAVGYSPYTIGKLQMNVLYPLIKQHNLREEKCYDPNIMAEFIRNIKQRFENGEISRKYSIEVLSGADKISRLCEAGKLEWSCPTKVSKYKLNDYYENVLTNYEAHLELHSNTRADVIWVAKKFFAWLIEHNHVILENITVDEIQKFIIHCASYMHPSSIHDIQLYLKKLCDYLFENDMISANFSILLSMKVSRESKMYPATAHSEIVAILEQIDRSTPKGKRNYAIILLGAVMGLRAVDITRLTLSDIDWKKGEIKIIQAKTDKALALPLTTDIGEAIKDYILYARPRTKDNNVFIRSVAPHTAIKDPVSIGNFFDYYRKKAGLSREAFDGKCFHSLRRTLGKNMVTSGVPVNTVSQVLGQENMNSAKKYISLDSENLKECSLDFSGISTDGGADI